MIKQVENLILEAGELIKALLKEDIEISNKSAKDWVTNIDTTVEQFLVKGIKTLDPQANFLTEEQTVAFDGLENLWIIDPIDGTTNLIHQRKDFAISVARYNRSQPEFGFVYDVMANQLYFAQHGKAATLNGAIIQSNLDSQSLNNGLLFGDIHRPTLFTSGYTKVIETIATFRFKGSAALEVVDVARGHGAAYVFPGINIWDIAAALIILQSMGGTWYFDHTIEGLPLKNEKSILLACANTAIRDELITYL